MRPHIYAMLTILGTLTFVIIAALWPCVIFIVVVVGLLVAIYLSLVDAYSSYGEDDWR
jgi:hypothetical protein